MRPQDKLRISYDGLKPLGELVPHLPLIHISDRKVQILTFLIKSLASQYFTFLI